MKPTAAATEREGTTRATGRRMFTGLRAIVGAVCAMAASASAAPGEYFGIRVVDEQTGRGVPLVELQTVSKVKYYTDSNGYVAFLEPGLMQQDVWFTISSPGYEFPKESITYKGALLKATPGKTVELKIRRTQLAERLYRSTGQGIYRDTVLLGKRPPVSQAAALLNRKVTGQDTAHATPYKGKVFWIWGDTNWLQHPLGNFFVTAATTKLGGKGGLDPSVGMEFDYFPNDANGFTKEMARVSGEPAPVWLDSLVVVKDDRGQDRLMSRFVRAGKELVLIDQGVLLYDDAKQAFESVKTFPMSEKRLGLNHQFRAVVDGKEYFYGVTPYPWQRVPATMADFADPEAYESFTCASDPAGTAIERDAAGKPVWKWRKGVQPLDRNQLKKWIAEGQLRREECPFDLTDVETDKPVAVHNASVYWNEYRKRWVMIAGQEEGTSHLGEMWYAEANAPEGPWKAARKVATHAKPKENMDLYNPLQHPYFAQEGGRIIYFEGTFTNTFSGTTHEVPLYEYNQLVYRLDLGDPRLKLPEPPPGLSEAKPSPLGAN